MNEEILEQLSEHPEWQRVLHAYAQRERELPEPVADDGDPETADDSSGRRRKWLPRVDEVEGVDESRLAPIHGKLIALGLLRFNLQGREAGVLYALTGESRRLLEAVQEQPDQTERPGDPAVPRRAAAA